MTEVASNLLDVMAPLVKEGKVRVTQSRRGVSIEINANVLFAPGRADLEPQSLAVLRAEAEKLKNEPFNLEITGHTDNVPISNSAQGIQPRRRRYFEVRTLSFLDSTLYLGVRANADCFPSRASMTARLFVMVIPIPSDIKKGR